MLPTSIQKRCWNGCAFSVAGIDVHPVAVHLARAAWVLAAQPAIQAAVEDGFAANVTVPVYLGDALQLRFRTGDMFAEHNVTVQVEDEENTELVFPVSLVKRAETFDALMGDVAEAIEKGDDPTLALDDNQITDSGERQTLGETISAMQRLHAEGRNHIWAYYTRNLVRPVALSRNKVDVIVGNPPWLNYNQTVSTLRTELERQSRSTYGIWAGGRYATHQDVAGLFFARSVDLYLKDGGVIAMVMPHSALPGGPVHEVANWNVGGRNGAAEGEDVLRPESWGLTSATRWPGTWNNWNPTPSSPFRHRWCLPDEMARTAKRPLWLAKWSCGLAIRGRPTSSGRVSQLLTPRLRALLPTLASPDRERQWSHAACSSWKRLRTPPSSKPGRPSQ